MSNKKILHKLKLAKENAIRIRKERDKLLEANRKLVNLLLEIEKNIDSKHLDFEQLDTYTYSYESGWEDGRDRVKIDILDTNKIERQIKEIEKILYYIKGK